MRRRAFLASASALALSGAARAMPEVTGTAPFEPELPRAMARDRAARPHAPRPLIPQAWRDLSYDEYRMIWFDPRRAVWAGEGRGFEMDLFHPGLYFPRAVEVAVVEDGRAHALAFDMDLFARTDQAPELPVDAAMGFSGLRLRHRFPSEANAREFAVFQGASYFRAIGAAQHYGLSARGLALNTGDAKGEEFPDFTRFWVETPAPGDNRVILHALLDSPSVAGAYRFEITPGPACEMRVECSLFPRVDLTHAGIAPLTSMFLYDQTNRPRFRDFRPAIHDSDGLAVWNGAGEMLWRPLANPVTLQTSSFVDDGPRGFGLMQRADRLSDFADLEAHYHERPSLWITPEGDWGPGVVRLVEIPSDREIYDNIVAYWRPREFLAAGREHRFAYRMAWHDAGADPRGRTDVARVIDTHMGLNFTGDRWLAAIDFGAHPELEGLEDVTLHVSSSRAVTSDGILQRNPETGGARLAFTFDPAGRDAVELRAQLMRGGRAISEVWLYRWTRA